MHSNGLTISVTRTVYTVSEKNIQNCFCHTFVKFSPTLIIFGRKIVKTIKLCKMH